MVVKVRTIPQMKVKYKDIFHLKNLYIMVHEYLLEEGFFDEAQVAGQAGHDNIEKLYMEKFCQKGIHIGGKELWIYWRTLKRPEGKYQGYYRYKLDIDMHIVALRDEEVIHQGKKLKIQWGEIEFFLRGTIEADYRNQWDNHWFLKHFHKIYYDRILSYEFEKREKELWRDIIKFSNKIKRYLDMRTFVPTPEPFWKPIYGHEA